MRRLLTQTMATGALVFLIAVAAPVGALACKSAGANVHVGVVAAVDARNMNFTLNDAESGEQIVFAAPARLLEGVKPGHELVVGYTETGGQLTAARIKDSYQDAVARSRTPLVVSPAQDSVQETGAR